MIVNKFFIDKLSLFGLNSYESKLWAALLSRGVATAGELAEIANVPRSRCYDVLETLEKKGFIISKIGKPMKYIAVHPEEVIERVKKNLLEKANADAEKLDSIRNTELMDELKTLHLKGIKKIDPEELSGLLRGRKNIYNHLATLIKNSKQSVYLMTTTTGLQRKFEKLYKELREAASRNVTIRIGAPLKPTFSNLIKEIEKLAEVRHANKSARFVIIDNEHLVFMMADDETVNPSYDIGLWVKSPFFVESMKVLFENSWEKMKLPKEVLK